MATLHFCIKMHQFPLVDLVDCHLFDNQRHRAIPD